MAETDLTLFGSWACSHTHRIQLALKLKNLSFTYIEQSPSHNPPPLPLHQNPPFLLTQNRPISESLIILHFLDENFPNCPPKLLPDSPLDRAAARLWAHFADHRLAPAAAAVFAAAGEAKTAAVERFKSELKIVETELVEGVFAGRRFFGGERMGFLDIVFGCGSYWLAVFEEVAEVRLVEKEEFPRFEGWLRDFEGQEEVKGIMPALDELLEYARGLRRGMVGEGEIADVGGGN